MSCAACQANVSHSVSKLKGVLNANVSLLSNSMVVEYDETLVNEEAIMDAVAKAGYGACPYVDKSLAKEKSEKEASLHKRFVKLMISVAFLVVLMAFSMITMILRMNGHPSVSSANYGWIVLLEVGFTLLLACPIIVLEFHIYQRGFKALIKGRPTMDSLVFLGSFVSLVYGIYEFGAIIFYLSRGDASSIYNIASNLYVESSGTVLVFVSIGQYIEDRAKEKTSSSIGELLSLIPDSCFVRKEGKLVEVPSSSLVVGDEVFVKEGGSVPTDGKIIDGKGDLDESLLSGESLPVHKEKEDNVVGGSICRSGSFHFVVEKVGNTTVLSQIVALAKEAGESKPRLAKLADKIALVFVPVVIGISLATFVTWMLISNFNGGVDVSLSIRLAISVLLISCPCALGLATPLSLVATSGAGAKNGILIKSASAMESLDQADYFLFDKTGTLSSGTMKVERFILLGGEEKELLSSFASLEQYSQHPLSKAIVSYALEHEGVLSEKKGFSSFQGFGVSDAECSLGNKAFFAKQHIDVSSLEEEANHYSSLGFSVIYGSKNKKAVALFIVGDSLKENAALAISLLIKKGKKVAMVSGDSQLACAFMAKQLGIEEVYSQVLPEEKEGIVDEIKSQGYKVAFIGDGVNDAPSLAKADVGIALGSGSDLAIDSADILLMNDDPLDVVSALSLAHKGQNNIKENLLWAFFYNLLLIPIAAGALYAVKTPQGPLVLTPTLASIAMSLSSLFVCLNALRLRRFKKIVPTKEAITMEKKIVVGVGGMMCEHCAAHVKEALSRIEGVSEVSVSLEDKEAEIVASSPIKEEDLKKAIEDAGYQYLGLR